MPPVAEQPALSTESQVADVIPEAAKKSLPDGNFAAVADSFWKEESAAPEKKDEPAKKAEDKPAETKVETKVEAKPLTLGEKLAAKSKPAVSADDAPPAVSPAKVDLPEDKLELDPKSSPVARENFKVLKGVAKAQRERADAAERQAGELRAKIDAAAKLPAAATNNVEFDKLKAEHKALSDRLLLLDTKNHPVFQQQYVKPRNDALAAATELLKANGKEADLAALIEKPRGEIGKALAELLKDVNPFDQTEISNGVQTAYRLAQGEKQALANAVQINGALRQHDSGTQVQAFETVFDKISAGVTEMLDPVEIPATASAEARAGIEGYNAAIAGLRANARQIATGAASYETIAEAATKAAAFDLHAKHVMPRLAMEFAAMQDVVRQLTKEVEGYRSRNPNKGIKATPHGGREESKAPSSIDEAADIAFGGRR